MPLILLACTRPVEDPLSAEALDAAARAQTDIGPRMVGTDGEVRAMQAVIDAFREAGLANVRTEPFTFDAWQPGTASVTLGSDTWPAWGLSPSPSGERTAPLATGDLQDAIALMHSTDGSRASQFLTAASGGADAMIRVTDERDHDGTTLVEVGHTLAGASLPSVAVDADVGAALDAAIGQLVTVRVDATTLAGHTSHNVLGEIAGTGPGTVYVTAHYDSWDPSESAFDNALGTAFQVLLARALASGPPPERTVVFLATSGEEQGLQGAFAYTEAHPDEAASASYVLNLDVPWAAEGRYLCAASDEWLRQRLVELAAAEGIDVVDVGVPNLSSDHFAFMVRGAPATWCERWPDRHYHTTRDELDEIDLAEATAALRVQWAVLAQLAEASMAP